MNRSTALGVALATLCPSALALPQADRFGPQNVLDPAADGAQSVVSADLDGDGDLDVLAASLAGATTVNWYANDGTGAFGPAQPISNAEFALSVFASDLDGDGDLDVLVASALDNSVSWYTNAGPGLFGPAQFITFGGAAVAAADVDGDGDQDVVSASGSDVGWHANDGTGLFGARQAVDPAVDSVWGLELADMDGDGDLDALYASSWEHLVAWAANDGSGGFAPRQVLNASAYEARSVAAADLDGDGDLDALSASSGDGKLAWYENLGAGAFADERLLSTSGTSPWSVTTADVDLDGDLDVLSAWFDGGSILWHRNLGSGAFGPSQLVSTATAGAQDVLAADLDGDGDPDVVSASRIDDKVASYENRTSEIDCNGNGVLDACEIALAPALDWDGDGVLDACAPPSPEFCEGNLNATGQRGRIELAGSPVVSLDDFTMRAIGLPGNQPGMFIMSRSTGYANPFGGGAGVLCLGAPIRRFHPLAGFPLQFSGANGEIEISPSIGAFPGPLPVQPGETLYFQLWHREADPATGNPRSNTTGAVAVHFRGGQASGADPVAGDDTGSVLAGNTVAINLLVNDQPPCSLDPATVTVVSQPSRGSVTVLDGIAQYTTDELAPSEAITFEYTVANIAGAVSAPGLVTVSVRAKDPIAVPDTGSVVAGATLQLDLLGNDVVFGGGPLVGTTVVLTDAPAGASVDAEGVLSWTPAESEPTGDLAFAYRVADTEGNVSNQASITVFLFAKPPIANDDTGSVVAGQSVTLNVLANDVSFGGGALDPTSVSVVGSPAGVSVNAEGQVIYSPNENEATRIVNLEYTVADAEGNVSNVGTASVSVSARAPIANDDAGAVTAGEALALDLLANDQTFGGGPLEGTTVALLGAPAGAAVDAAGVLSYTPAETDPTGTLSLQYTVADAEGNVSNAATVTVAIASKPPIALDDSGSVTAGEVLTLELLANDVSFGGGALDLTTAVLVGGPAGASVGADGLLTYAPSQDELTRIVTFGYRVADLEGNDSNVGLITIDLTAKAPVAGDDAGSVTAGDSVTIDVLANDVSFGGGALQPGSVTLVGAPAGASVDGAGLVTVPTQETDPTATLSFSYTVADAEGLVSNAALVTVAVASKAPIANGDSGAVTAGEVVTLDLLANDQTFGGGPLDGTTVATVGAPAGVSVGPDGVLTYAPDAQEPTATVAFSYRVQDAEGNLSNAAPIVIERASKAPIAGDDTGAVTAGQSVSLSILANDQTFGGGPLDPASVVLTGAPANATVDPSGLLTYASGELEPSGPVSFSYTVQDTEGNVSTAGAVTVEVAAKDPLAGDDAGAITAGQALVLDLLANDTTFGGGPPVGGRVALLGAPANATVDAAGVLTYAAAELEPTAVVAFTYTVQDTEGNRSNVASVTIQVAALPPLAGDDSGAVDAGQILSLDLLANDQSYGGGPIDPASVTLLGAPVEASVNANGVLTFAPGPLAATGPVAFQYTVADASGNVSNAATVTVQVTALPPIANADSGTVVVGQTLVLDLLANDISFGGGPLDPTSVVLSGAPLTATVSVAGVLSFTSGSQDPTGLLTFTYTVADASGSLSNAATISIDVVPVFGPETLIHGATQGARHAISCDVDGDGDRDVVSAASGQLAWHANLGGGAFGPRTVIASNEGQLVRVASGDLDGDGAVDLVVASNSGNRLAWFRNLGAGSFSSRIVLTGNAEEASSVGVADVDGDGDLDVFGTAEDSDRVLLLRNLGSGVFTSAIVLDNDAGGPMDIQSGDLDGDGDLDLVVASSDHDRVQWYENNGGGLFGPAQIVGNNVSDAESVALADLDGDGDLDVAAASSSLNGGVVWLANLGGGAFSAPNVVVTFAAGADFVDAGDLDGDGAIDLLVSSRGNGTHAWYANQGAGTNWVEETLSSTAPGASSLVATDLDGDGDLDVLATTRNLSRVCWFERLGG